MTGGRELGQTRHLELGVAGLKLGDADHANGKEETESKDDAVADTLGEDGGRLRHPVRYVSR